jgi:predicted transcriptional regulator
VQVITVRLPDDLAAALKEHKRRTDVPVEAFVRRAIRSELEFEARPEVQSVRAEQAAKKVLI